jgi:hypothetical protein
MNGFLEKENKERIRWDLEFYFLYYLNRAHNQRWNFRDGYIYASADPRLVLDTKVSFIFFK